MRELVLSMSMSLDGFVSGPDGEIDWIFTGDEEAVAWKAENAWNASLHIMGSRTFAGMAKFWPSSDSIFAPPMNEIPKAVFSKQGAAILTNMQRGDGNLAQNGEESWKDAYVAGGDLATEIAALKAADGKPILAHGGASLARSLVASGLVDQYMLMIHPVVLGTGMSIFSAVSSPRFLKLVSSRAFSKGAVAQIYRPL